MIRIKKMACLIIAAIILALSVSATIYSEETTDYDGEEAEPQRRAMLSRVMITDYFVESGGFISGEVSAVTFILKNMSRVSNVTSVLLVGWVDSVTPVEFAGTNQAYVEIISPGEEVAVVFEYYTKNVDMTAISDVSAGFTIYYCDGALGGSERTNSVSVKLPVMHGTRTAIDEEYMQWSTPWVSDRDRILSSNIMQALYTGGFVCSGIWIILLILFKFGVLKRKV